MTPILALALLAVKLYPVPAGVEPSPLYRVRVNGQTSFVYPVTVNPTGEYQNIAAPAAMTHFDLEGKATVEIESPEEVSAATVHPASRKIKVETSGKRIRFMLTEPGNFVVFVNGSRDRPLFVFANPPEKDAPGPNDPNVIFFGPGVHAPGLINLASNQTLYLAGGAFVKGRVKSQGARNASIRGRGILYGGDFQKEAMGGDKFIMFVRCDDVRIEGVVSLDAFGWNVMLAGCRNVVVDNVKVIGWRKNSDGINPVSSENVAIRNCFIKNQDDGISIKGSEWAGPVLKNISIEKCTMWQNWMRSFVLGGEMTVARTEKISFRDSDILYSGVNPKSAGNRDAALSVWNVDSGVAGDVLFEDIRIEEAVRLVRLALFKNKHSRHPGWGHIDGVTFRNITVERGPGAIEITGHSEEHLTKDVLFENLRIDGKKISAPSDSKSYRADEFSRGIQFR